MMQLASQLRTDGEGCATAMPPGTPWMADPVVAAWQAQDAEAGTALTAALEDLLADEHRALRALGVELRDLGLGLVEMPSYLDAATEVLLCWTPGERAISSYRLPASTYRARKPTEGHAFEAELASELSPSGPLRD